jgi:hypothetical protein
MELEPLAWQLHYFSVSQSYTVKEEEKKETKSELSSNVVYQHH